MTGDNERKDWIALHSRECVVIGEVLVRNGNHAGAAFILHELFCPTNACFVRGLDCMPAKSPWAIQIWMVRE